MRSEPLRFTLEDFRAGLRQCLPVALGVGVYGVLFGLLARQKGLSLAAAMSMSAGVFAGASQLVAMDLWGPDLPVASLIVTTAIVNLRHVLMSAAFSPWLSRLSPLQAYGSLFFMTDESWALTLGRLTEDRRAGRAPAGAYLLGSGLCVYLCWNLSTALGHTLVRGLTDPARYGLDFAFTAVFVALLVGLYRKPKDLPPWAVSAATAILMAQLLPGKWYILAGAVAGGLTAALRTPKNAATAGERP